MALVRPLLHEGVVRPHHVAGPRNPNRLPNAIRARVAGMVVCRQRPVTASGLLFMSLEDEWGMTNVVVYKHIQERFREFVFGTPFLIVEGRNDNEQGGFPHVIAERFYRCLPARPRSLQVTTSPEPLRFALDIPEITICRALSADSFTAG